MNVFRLFADKFKPDCAKLIMMYKKTQSEHGGLSTYEYASAFPYTQTPTTRDDSGPGDQIFRHKQWVAISWRTDNLQDLGLEDSRLSKKIKRAAF